MILDPTAFTTLKTGLYYGNLVTLIRASCEHRVRDLRYPDTAHSHVNPAGMFGEIIPTSTDSLHHQPRVAPAGTGMDWTPFTQDQAYTSPSFGPETFLTLDENNFDYTLNTESMSPLSANTY